MKQNSPWYLPSSEGFTLVFKVSPSAKKTRVLSCLEEAPWIKIAIQSPPEKGKANHMLLLFLADILDVRASDCHLIAGSTSHIKKVSIGQKISYKDILRLLDIARN